jgi:hypothetical protein
MGLEPRKAGQNRQDRGCAHPIRRVAKGWQRRRSAWGVATSRDDIWRSTHVLPLCQCCCQGIRGPRSSPQRMVVGNTPAQRQSIPGVRSLQMPQCMVVGNTSSQFIPGVRLLQLPQCMVVGNTPAQRQSIPGVRSLQIPQCMVVGNTSSQFIPGVRLLQLAQCMVVGKTPAHGTTIPGVRKLHQKTSSAPRTSARDGVRQDTLRGSWSSGSRASRLPPNLPTNGKHAVCLAAPCGPSLFPLPPYHSPAGNHAVCLGACESRYFCSMIGCPPTGGQA